MPTTDNPDAGCLRLTQETVQRLLDTLDQAEALGTVPKENRKGTRTRYRTLDVLIRVLNDRSNSSKEFRTATRNISAGGLAFLYRQMLPPGQRLEIEIPMLDSRVLTVSAVVVRCRHVDGMVHEVGVQFTRVLPA